LAALLIASETPVPRLLGADPIEFVLRRARFAGVAHAVIYVQRVTSPLLAIVDGLRGEGLSVDIARTVADAAELIHPDEAVLLIAPDVVVAPATLLAVATSPDPVLLCVRDEPGNARFELIDPTARWTGIARIDGGLLRRTAAMVGDWDLGSTLMRRAAQEGAARMTLTPDQAGAELLVIDTNAAAQAAGRSLLTASPVQNAGWATRWVTAPIARVIARVAGDLSLDAQWVTLAGFALFGLATLWAAAGWLAASLLTLILGMICDLAGALGTQAGAGTPRWEKYRLPVRASAAVFVALAAGTTMTLRTAQWGCIVLALVIVAATWLAMPLARDDERMTTWRSDSAGHVVIGLVGLALGSPVMALAVCATHAMLSLGWAMRKALSGLARS
jgi:hypothetical protein